MAKQYKNVRTMISDISDNKEFNESLKKEIDARDLSRALSALRNAKNLSESNLVAKAGLSKVDIQRIESSRDFDLTIGDIVKYSESIGMKLEVGFSDKGTTIAHQIKYHYFHMMILLDKLLEICKGDQDIEKGVSSFTKEVYENVTSGLLKIVERAERLGGKQTKQSDEPGLVILSPSKSPDLRREMASH